MSKKLLLLLSLTLILGVMAFCLWRMDKAAAPVATPQSSPEEISEMPNASESIDTSDWKTYRNEEYGFEFRYPNNINWSVEEFDYSNNRNLGYYPEKGVKVFYKFTSEQMKDSASESLIFSVTDSRWESGNVHLRDLNHPSVYTFDFQGETATANRPWQDDKDRDAVYNFFYKNQCIGTVSFGLPKLPSPWTSNNTVTVFCGSPLAPQENIYIFKSILNSVDFFR